MPAIETAERRRSPRFLSALAIALGLALFPACSSDSDSSADADTATTVAAANDGADTDDAGDTDGAGLPAGFPDIPLPDFESADVVKSATETAPGWSVLFTVDPTLEKDGDEILTAYVEQLEAAGYEIEGDTSDVSIEATKDGTDIHFHSSMDGTITIGVIEP